MIINEEVSFFALVRCGLWGDCYASPCLNLSKKVNWEIIHKLSQEQSVIGIVLQGIEYYKNNLCDNLNNNISKALMLQWIAEVQVIEQRNKRMDAFIADLIEKLRKYDIYALLVKGQGVAQCYEKPLWRTSGDVDLFLSDDNYNKAKFFLRPMATNVDEEGISEKHLGMTIDNYIVELHGTLYGGLSKRVDNVLDDIKRDVFCGGKVRSWLNGNTHVFLLNADDDAVYVFTHFLQHFYKGGIGLRQICDWCRLLWTYRDTLNHENLESRIRKMGLMSEWKAFGAFAIEYLGMPAEAMPFLNEKEKSSDARRIIDKCLKKKADKICGFIMEVGNFGQNRDMSYYRKYPYVIRKAISAWWRMKDLCRHAMIFPLDSLRFSFSIMFNGFRSAVRGE